MTCRCGHDFLWYAVTAALGVQTVPLHPLHATYNAPFKTVPLHPFHATSNAPFLRIAAPSYGLPRLRTDCHAFLRIATPSYACTRSLDALSSFGGPPRAGRWRVCRRCLCAQVLPTSLSRPDRVSSPPARVRLIGRASNHCRFAAPP